MNLISKKPLTLAEAHDLVSSPEDRKQIMDYFKKFTKLSKEESQKLSEDIRSLNNLKIKGENIVKLIDLSPQDSEDVHKVFTDVSLTEEEANAILKIFGK